MRQVILSLLLIGYALSAPIQSGTDMKELQKNILACNKALLSGDAACKQEEGCFYFEYFVKEFEEFNEFCWNIDVFKKMIVEAKHKNQDEYLKFIKIDKIHSQVVISSICEILDFDPQFPEVRNCLAEGEALAAVESAITNK